MGKSMVQPGSMLGQGLVNHGDLRWLGFWIYSSNHWGDIMGIFPWDIEPISMIFSEPTTWFGPYLFCYFHCGLLLSPVNQVAKTILIIGINQVLVTNHLFNKQSTGICLWLICVDWCRVAGWTRVRGKNGGLISLKEVPPGVKMC